APMSTVGMAQRRFQGNGNCGCSKFNYAQVTHLIPSSQTGCSVSGSSTAFPAVNPPSTFSSAPVMNEEYLLNRYKMASATSSLLATRPNGCDCPQALRISVR